jgi:hypothetical protein
MECHEARLLLAFTRPGSDAMDAAERALVQAHVEACPECAAAARSEEAVDRAFGTAMREVAVPAGLQQRVLTKVRANKPYPWPPMAAAAAVLLLVAGAGTWWYWPKPPVAIAEVDQVFNPRFNKVEEVFSDVEAYFKAKGVAMEAYRQLDPQYLWSFDVTEFQGRRVARMVFLRTVHDPGLEKDRAAAAQVIVLPTSQFNTSELSAANIPSNPNRIIIPVSANPQFVYIIGTTEESLQPFLLPPAN